jgi:LPS export ABC transporter protein LptC
MVPASAVDSLPSATAKDIYTVFTDSGKVQLILKTPILEKYDKADEPYTEFREGINVIFYDGNPNPVGTVSARYAKYIDSKRLWELRDSVVVINKENEKLETELLFWNQQKDLIYTERFIKFTTEDEIIQGTGFESDSRLTKREIRKISGIIYINEENEK